MQVVWHIERESSEYNVSRVYCDQSVVAFGS